MSQSHPLSTEDLAGRQVPTGEYQDSGYDNTNPEHTGSEYSDPDQTGYANTGSDQTVASTVGTGSAEQAVRRDDDEDVSLVAEAQAGEFRERWSGVQARFVDDPRAAVGAADALVAELMQTLAAGFADHKGRLETQWQGGGEADTEELRLALRRYRVFFQRLLQT